MLQHTYTIRTTGTFPNQNKNEIVMHLMAAFREFVQGTFEVKFEPSPGDSEDFHVVVYREWDVDAAHILQGGEKSQSIRALRAVDLLRSELMNAHDFHGMPTAHRLTIMRLTEALKYGHPVVVLPQRFERTTYNPEAV